MNDYLPLHGMALYNPNLLSKRESLAYFIARKPLLNRIIGDLKREGNDEVPQHRLILGIRGMGKTTLLHRIAYAIEDDPELEAIWLPLTFPEEQYNIAGLADFWLNCLDALGDFLERTGNLDEMRALDAMVRQIPAAPEPEKTQKTLDILLFYAAKAGKRLVLLVDNMDIILERLKKEHWALREVFSSETRLLLMGAGSRLMESTYKYEGAFYDFFKIHELRGITEEEMFLLLRNLGKIHGNERVSRLLERDPTSPRVIHNLSGGNPRTIAMLYGILAHGLEGDVRGNLESLLDLCTPLYKARFEELSPQAQRVVDALALHWDPTTAGILAKKVDLSVNTVSAQLNRLEHWGIVEKTYLSPGKKTGFQIAERFFNIWYLMRASRRIRRKLAWLVEFLKIFYSQDELKRQGTTHLHAGLQPGTPAPMKYAEYGFVLARAVEHSPLRNALENAALHRLETSRGLPPDLHELLDLEGEDAELKPKVERLRLLSQIRESVFNLPNHQHPIPLEELWRLLGGSPYLSLEKKKKIADGLKTHTEDQLQTQLGVLRVKFKVFAEQICDEDIASNIYDAIRSGDMAGLQDREGAEAAALNLDVSELPIIARIKQYRHVEKKSNSKLYRSLAELSFPGGWVYLGITESAKGNTGKAEQCFKKAHELSSNLSLPLLALGILYHKKKKFLEARKYLEKALALNPENANAMLELGWFYQEHRQDVSKAEELYLKAIEYEPYLAEAWFRLGYLYMVNERFEEAEKAWLKAVALEPENRTSLKNLACTYFLLRRFEEVENLCQKSLALDDQDAETWFILGSALARLDRFEEAEAAFRKALALDDQDAETWTKLGTALTRLARLEEAEVAYRKALSIDPAYARPLINLGSLYYDLTKYEEAEELFRKAISLDAQDAVAWRGLGATLISLDRFEEAEAATRKALELNPDSAIDWIYLAIIFRELENYQEAETAVRKAIDLAPGVPEFQASLALFLRARDRWEEAFRAMAIYLGEGSEQSQEQSWDFIISFFEKAVGASQGEQALQLLEETGLAERWRPLKAALQCVVRERETHLSHFAPEVRRPAKDIIKKIAPWLLKGNGKRSSPISVDKTMAAG